MKSIAATLSFVVVLAMVAQPVRAETQSAASPVQDQLVESPQTPSEAQSEERTVKRARQPGPGMAVRRELTHDDLLAAFAVLFLGQVSKGSSPAMAVQLTHR